MTQLSRPESMGSSDLQIERVNTSITLQLESRFYTSKFTESYEKTILFVEALVDLLGQTLEPVWEDDWTAIAPGIRSKRDTIEIQSFACPVQISFRQERVGRLWNRHTWETDPFSNIHHFKVRYESD